MKKALAVATLCLILAGCSSKSTVSTLTPQQQAASFLQLCQQKDSLPAPTRSTIEVLLNEAGTKDCQKADLKLKSMTELDLFRNKISDLSPLAGFTNLTILDLSINEISDVSALSELVNLKYLSLSNNNLVDVSPLAKLINLNFLGLNNNKIKTIQSLGTLTNVTDVSILDNQGIDNICPLESHICSF
jgi:internalin A